MDPSVSFSPHFDYHRVLGRMGVPKEGKETGDRRRRHVTELLHIHPFSVIVVNKLFGTLPIINSVGVGEGSGLGH